MAPERAFSLKNGLPNGHIPPPPPPAPPPSTAAAQLVDHYSHLAIRRIQQWPDSFRQLLEEILQGGNEATGGTRIQETDVDINSKVIVVVIEAGLSGLHGAVPFLDDDPSYQQARTILEVIALTIRRHPEVLHHVPLGQSVGASYSGPLYLWLLPRILDIPVQFPHSGILRGIVTVLHSITLAESALVKKNTEHCPTVLKYFKSCLNDVSNFLERRETWAGTAKYAIPSLETLEGCQEGSELVFSKRSTHQITISDPSMMLRLAATLGFAISRASSSGDIPGSQETIANHEIMLIMHVRVWRIISQCDLHLSTDEHWSQAVELSIDAFQDFFGCCTTAGLEDSTASQKLYLFHAIFRSLFSFTQRIMPIPVKSSLSNLLNFMLYYYRNDSDFLQHTLRNIARLDLKSRRRFTGGGEDLDMILLELDVSAPDKDTTMEPSALQSKFSGPDLQSRCLKLCPQLEVIPAYADYSTSHIPIAEMIGIPDNVGIDNLKQSILNHVPELDEKQQLDFYLSIGSLVCRSAGSPNFYDGGNRSSFARVASNCCLSPTLQARPRSRDNQFAGIIEESMTALLQLPRAQKSRRSKVAAINAMRRIAAHTANLSALHISTSIFGQWCLQALRSSSRQMRIAAGRTLHVFLRTDIECLTLNDNRIRIFDFLRSLSANGDLALQETCILSWAQLAKVCDADERNIALLRLIEYLGHSHQIVSTLAYNEIQEVCSALCSTPFQLFSPYWRTIAPKIVTDIQRRPQLMQQIAELLSIAVSEFLQLTQVYTIPLLVLNQRRDILLKVAAACNRSLRAMCLDHTNLASTLAFLLLQPSQNRRAMVSSSLATISADFSETECMELLRTEPILTASELLKAAADGQMETDEPVKSAVQFLANVTCGRQYTPRENSPTADVIGAFFNAHVLGIMAHLTDVINDGRGLQSIPEKRRCLGAIREMISIARRNVSTALPQISACLQAAITQKDLCNEALEAWTVMVGVVGEDQIGALIQPTFAIVAEHWSSFDSTRQNAIYSMISRLIQTHSTVVRNMVNHIPSLAPIPLMSKFEVELGRLKSQIDVRHHLMAFSQRCQDENATVVKRALVELEIYLCEFQGTLHVAAVNEQPESFVSSLVRTILDACIRFNSDGQAISVLCARCLGLIGCLDPTRIEAAKDERVMLLLSNFSKAEETTDFLLFFIRKVLVKVFLSASNPRSQGFLAYAMQELLSFCHFDGSIIGRVRDAPSNPNYVRWMELPESTRNTLIPFLSSKYIVTSGMLQTEAEYPIYKLGIAHGQWLRIFALDLLQKGTGDNPKHIFPVLSRVIRLQDVSLSSFLVPYLVLNVVVGGTIDQMSKIGRELFLILKSPLPDTGCATRDALLSCSQSVFDILDYLSRWMHEKRKVVALAAVQDTRRLRVSLEANQDDVVIQIKHIEQVLSMIPAETISSRAVECRSFSRALLHWEQFIRQRKELATTPPADEPQYFLHQKLQEIYTQIDEPDGIEGISSHLRILDIEQQVLEHRKGGRWTAVQSWYELRLDDRPEDGEVQRQLLTSLKASGQHDVLLNQVASFKKTPENIAISLPFAAEAAWVTSRWSRLAQIVDQANEFKVNDFNIGIASALLALSRGTSLKFLGCLDRLRYEEVKTMSPNNTVTIQACHESMMRLHVLAELEMIGGLGTHEIETSKLLTSLDQRLAAVGAFFAHKQYILGLRRAGMELSRRSDISTARISAAWLTSAKLARKGGFTHQAFNAVLHAARLGDESAAIEHARLLWREGHHRKAIQTLEGAIASNAFQSHDLTQTEASLVIPDTGVENRQNLPKGRACLLLAKWVDRAGQTESDSIVKKYHRAVESNQRWEKGHYYLGRHYNKLFESEKVKTPDRQSQSFITGETAKLVIENYLRALCFGAKYLYQTLPRILTLWLQLGSEVEQPLDLKYGNDEKFLSHIANQRRRLLTAIHVQLKKYVDRLPAFVFYTAISQIFARICHSNQIVFTQLMDVIVKVVAQHPQQALWTLLATVKSSVKERANRGQACVFRVVEAARKSKADSFDLKNLIAQCQKLSEQLLRVCEGPVAEKASHISITKDLGFNHKLSPCKIVVPLEATLTAKLPPVIDKVQMRSHKAFSKDTIMISSFLEDVLVLNSLQKPRKICVRGSDGNIYALLCKPKDDLRKDQRLMEFNAMINRSLRRDADSSKRRLYIRTYAVTPLNEECGLIEWVDKLKPLRDILISAYRQKGVSINYQEIRKILDQACLERDVALFTEKVLPKFQPAFHEWFIELFPEPSSWFEARLRYTRSCAVMSIVGHVLGLGDRHGENVLFEEGNGGTFHVDFNCLFDKGLTFEKPEVVPFRLTHNMVDAFGAYGYEGPFRKSSELTLGILRSNEATLMTILETFLYDPTTDFIGGKRRKNSERVPDTPEGVLENIRNKVSGMLEGESVPLSVDGYIQKLIEEATDPWNLCQMYIGWCAFF